MDRVQVEAKVLEILNTIHKADIKEYDKNLFSREIDFSYQEMAYVFMAVEKEFNVDLNKLIELYENATVNNLVNGICQLKAS